MLLGGGCKMISLNNKENIILICPNGHGQFSMCGAHSGSSSTDGLKCPICAAILQKTEKVVTK
jgi:hypothetical protein